MRYLIHSEDATFDTETGKYIFNLDRRITDPRRIRINSAAYIAPTMATYPQVVYLRSSKLSEAVRRKHTVELKNDSHENATDTLCVLHETHTPGRYNMDTQSKRNFAVHSHLPLRKIDFYFTNNRTNLGATASSSSAEGVTDQDILNITDLIFFLDYDHTDLILPANIAVDDSVTSITSRLTPDSYAFVSTVVNGLKYSTFGETHSMLSEINWHSAVDSTTVGNVNEGDTACLTMMFRTKDTLTGWNWIFKSPLFQISTGEALDSATNMGYYDADSSLFGYTSLVIEGAKDYLLQIKKSSNAFSWLLRDLNSEVEQTEDTTDTAATGTANETFYLSNSQTGFLGMKISHVIEFLSVTDADCLAVKNWMIQKYTGESVEEESSEASKESTFFVELDID